MNSVGLSTGLVILGGVTGLNPQTFLAKIFFAAQIVLMCCNKPTRRGGGEEKKSV